MDKPLIELLSELVDECGLDKPLNWEATNYEEVKLIAITHALEVYEKSSPLELQTILAYLLMENTQLWIENQSQLS
jgi:hypothetical protein